MIPKSSRRLAGMIILHANLRVLLRLITTAFCVAALVASGAFVQNIESKNIEIQGTWTYSWPAAPDDMVEMATTPAIRDSAVSLLLACSGNGRLTVALMHADYFPFELGESSSVQLQSARVSITAAVAERAQAAQIVLDATLVRLIMSLAIEEQELALSVTAKDGIVHRYTFALSRTMPRLRRCVRAAGRTEETCGCLVWLRP